jgi:hypothetical protein
VIAQGPGEQRAARRDWSFMTIALALWIGTLPFVFVLVTPLRGVPAALTAAFVMLVVLVVVCWAVCAWQPPDE